MSKKLLFTNFIIWIGSLVLVFYFSHQVSAREDHSSDEYKHLRLFTDVLALVKKNYVKEVDIKEAVEGAVNGMLVALDPHSNYLSPEIFDNLKIETKGVFGGLGIEITMRDGMLTVVTPLEDSPASRAGILPGDKIIKISDEFTKNLTLMKAIEKLRGPEGTGVTISIAREGVAGLIPINIVREVIKVDSVRGRFLESGIIYVRIAQFQEGTGKELEKTYKKFLKTEKTISGLILDVRNNPGGLLTEAIKVSDFFIKDGVLVYTDGRLEDQKQKYYARDEGNEPDFPVVVLVNNGSASASEILAGAFKDHERGLILGEQTFGKGSVQTVLPIGNGGALRLTTGLYYTKSGVSIQAEGIKPDIEVKLKQEENLSSNVVERPIISEKNLPGAIDNPNTIPESRDEKEDSQEVKKDKLESFYVIGSRTAMKMDIQELKERDNQIDEALRLLKSWKIFGSSPSQSEIEAQIREAREASKKVGS